MRTETEQPVTTREQRGRAAAMAIAESALLAAKQRFEGVDKTGEKLSLEELGMPHEGNVHPRIKKITAESIGAAETAGLVQLPAAGEHPSINLLKLRFVADLGPMFYPDAEDETALAASLYINWLFFLDNIFDNKDVSQKNKELFKAAIVRLIKTGERYWGLEYENELLEEMSRLLMYTGKVFSKIKELFAHTEGEPEPRGYAEFCNRTEQYLTGSILDASNAQTQTVPTYKEFCKQREQAGGSLPCILLLEITKKITAAAEHPVELHELETLCALIMSFANDIFSAPKEGKDGENNPNNLIRVLMDTEGLNEYTAYHVAKEIVKSLVERFYQILEYVPANSATRAWAEGMEQMIKANYDWSIITERYQYPNHPIRELNRAPKQKRSAAA